MSYWNNQTNEVTLTFPLSIALSLMLAVIMSCAGIIIYYIRQSSEPRPQTAKQKKLGYLLLGGSILLSILISRFYAAVYSRLIQGAKNPGLNISLVISLSFIVLTILICTSMIIYTLKSRTFDRKD